MTSLEALSGTAGGIDYFIEREEPGLFTHDEYREAFEKAQLQVFYDKDAVLFDARNVGMYWAKKKVDHISDWTREGFRQRRSLARAIRKF